jgi:hypothetical protein
MSEDLIDLAISMVEIDTGVKLSLEERDAMKQRIKVRIEDLNK